MPNWQEISDHLKKHVSDKVHFSINAEMDGLWRVLFRYKTSCRSWEGQGMNLDELVERVFKDFMEEA